MRPALALAALLLPVVVVSVPAEAGCAHLLTDPAGDATNFGYSAPYPGVLDNPSQVDVRWAELRTTRTQLVATVKLTDLNPEGSQTLDHAYSVTFTTGTRAFQLLAMFGQDGTEWSKVNESVAGAQQPDDGGAYVGRTVGTLQAVRDVRHDRVVLTVDRGLLGGANGKVVDIGATGWGAVKTLEGGTYAVADRARTNRVYRSGTPDCLTRD